MDLTSCFCPLWRAVEAVAIVTWPALAGKGSLGVMTIGVLVAPARLALIYVLADSTISYEPWQAGADIGGTSSVAALSSLRNITVMGAFFTGVHGLINLDAGLPISAKPISILTFTAEGPGLVVADSMGAADLSILSALINVIARATVTIEASSTLAGEVGPLSRSTNSVGVAAVSSSETWVLRWLSSVGVPDLVAHGEPDEFIISIVHDKDLIHAEHLCGFHVSQRLVM